VRNNFLFVFWFTFFFVSILRQPSPSLDPSNYQRVKDHDNTLFEEQPSVSKGVLMNQFIYVNQMYNKPYLLY